MYISVFKDVGGMPRAWSASKQIIDSQASAKIELEAYRDSRTYRESMEPFTLVTSYVHDEELNGKVDC